MRGFAGVLLLLAIILASGILLMSNMQTTQQYSFKEMIPQTKAQMSNFEITLKQMVNGCDFATPTDAMTCIDGNASLLHASQPNDDCHPNNSTPGIEPATYNLTIICTKKAGIGANTIQIDTNRTILIKKL